MCSSDLFIKNGSHGTIHTFKNYFATVFFSFQFQFSVFSCIQTDPKRPVRERSKATQRDREAGERKKKREKKRQKYEREIHILIEVSNKIYIYIYIYIYIFKI